MVVLHGLARSHRSVAGMRRAIERAGFPTWSESYPSTAHGLRELAEALAGRIRRDVSGDVMAVTHSLGGVLVRHMTAMLPWKGAVLVAPPNRGSRVALRMRGLPLYRWLYGPSGHEVADGAEWPAPPSPFGVIAGVRAVSIANPTSWLTRGAGLLPPTQPSDGTVSLDETRLDGMADFATVDASHTFIMDHPDVQRWTVRFLTTGRFRDGG